MRRGVCYYQAMSTYYQDFRRAAKNDAEAAMRDRCSQRLIGIVVEMAREVYELSRSGCHLHIVLDDGNLEDCHILACIDDAYSYEDLCPTCLLVGHMLLKCTAEERDAIYARYDEYAR